MKRLKSEAKELREEIREIVEKSGAYVDVERFRDTEVKVVVRIYEDWYCNDGSIKKKDIANREKFLIDSVFDSLGLDDKNIFDCKGG